MTFGRIQDNQFILRLERGEEVLSVLKIFCQDHRIKNASVSGIGSIESPTLAHYTVDTKKYSEKELVGVYEVTALLGTVALFEKQPLLHLHITLGDESMQAFAGHLVSGTVSATLEVIITVLPSAFEKEHDEEIGLKLYTFPKQK
ncbi:MAG: DNA-binding protein [Candidatus Levybacteria bacterium]|nr:DNA-binding protein [Candidatus Levybacteria bacterium]